MSACSGRDTSNPRKIPIKWAAPNFKIPNAYPIAL